MAIGRGGGGNRRLLNILNIPTYLHFFYSFLAKENYICISETSNLV